MTAQQVTDLIDELIVPNNEHSITAPVLNTLLKNIVSLQTTNPKFYSGTTEPLQTDYNEGDVYLNTVTFDLFKKQSNNMALLGNIKGTNGTNGSNGTNGTNGINGTNGTNGLNFLSGSGVPSDSLGVDNELYLDINTYNIYKKVSGTWQ